MSAATTAAAERALDAWRTAVRARVAAAEAKLGRRLSGAGRRAMIMQMGPAPMACCGRVSGHAVGCCLSRTWEAGS